MGKFTRNSVKAVTQTVAVKHVNFILTYSTVVFLQVLKNISKFRIYCKIKSVANLLNVSDNTVST